MTLEIRELHAGYHGHAVLKGVDLQVADGRVVALLGPNGSGKTTLINVIAGRMRASSGQVVFDGTPLDRLRPYQRAHAGICAVYGGQGVFRGMTVKENLALSFGGRNPRGAVDMVADIFPVLGRRLGQRAGLLSGGEQQMLSLARAFLKRPKLVIADELCLGLGPLVVDEIFAALARLRDSGSSVLLVEQYVHRALGLAEEVVILNGGRVRYSGATGDALETDLVNHYLGTGVS
jgi:branched-chain amino acid transport system ATP-binding protein